MTGNADNNSQVVANMWVNYLVNKKTAKFPKELGKYKKKIIITLKLKIVNIN
jgi:hypothetical protein